MYKLQRAEIWSGNLTKGFLQTETENERVESCVRVAANRYTGAKYYSLQ